MASSGTTCVITGATSGIGRAAAMELARNGMKLLLVSRTRAKGEALLSELQQRTGNASSELFVADLSGQESIRTLAEAVTRNHPAIDILINNAGGIFGTRQETVDGLELTFALNHLSYFLLTNLLLDSLKASPGARIINVSSEAHKVGTMDFEDLNSEHKYSALKAYANTKLANLLFTYELARRLGDRRISVSALHPGAVRTNFGRDLPGVGGIFFRHIGFMLRSPERGAETMVWLATAPEPEGKDGKYFLDKNEVRSSRISYNESIAQRLWQESARITGIKE